MRLVVFILLSMWALTSCLVQQGDDSEIKLRGGRRSSSPAKQDNSLKLPRYYNTGVIFKEISGDDPAQVSAAIQISLDSKGEPKGMQVVAINPAGQRPEYVSLSVTDAYQIQGDSFENTFNLGASAALASESKHYQGVNKDGQTYRLAWNTLGYYWGLSLSSLQLSSCAPYADDPEVKCTGYPLDGLGSMEDIGKKYFAGNGVRDIEGYRKRVGQYLCNAKPSPLFNEYLIERHRCEEELVIHVHPLALQFLQDKGVTCERKNGGMRRRMKELRLRFPDEFSMSNRHSLLVTCSDGAILIGKPKNGGVKITTLEGGGLDQQGEVRVIDISEDGLITSDEKVLERK